VIKKGYGELRDVLRLQLANPHSTTSAPDSALLRITPSPMALWEHFQPFINTARVSQRRAARSW